MNRFYKTFFSEPPQNTSELTLFAFGKHPGWNDHIEGLGIHNDTLALCHSVFYVNGIRAVIDSGIWERTDPVKIIPEFGNLVYWQGRKSFIACRMWPSKDGMGRSKYPMIVGLFGGGVSLMQAGPMIFPVLEKLETRCRQAKTAEEVRSILAEAKQNLKADMGTLSGGAVVPPLEKEVFREFFDSSKIKNGEEGWMRILYTMNNQFSAFSRGSFNIRTAGDREGQSIRVPLLRDSPGHGMLEWLRLLRPEIDPQVPIFVSTAHNRPWADILVGEPDPQDFSCLKMNLEGIPFAHDVPYNIADTFREHARNCMDVWKRGGVGEAPVLFNNIGANGLRGADQKGAGGWWKQLFGGHSK